MSDYVADTHGFHWQCYTPLSLLENATRTFKAFDPPGIDTLTYVVLRQDQTRAERHLDHSGQASSRWFYHLDRSLHRTRLATRFQ